MRLTAAERRAIVKLPGKHGLNGFPEGIELNAPVADKKTRGTEGKSDKGKKVATDKTRDQGEAIDMGRGKCIFYLLTSR